MQSKITCNIFRVSFFSQLNLFTGLKNSHFIGNILFSLYLMTFTFFLFQSQTCILLIANKSIQILVYFISSANCLLGIWADDTIGLCNDELIVHFYSENLHLQKAQRAVTLSMSKYRLGSLPHPPLCANDLFPGIKRQMGWLQMCINLHGFFSSFHVLLFYGFKYACCCCF